MPVTINGSTGVTFPNSTLQASAAPGGGTTTTSAVDITLTATSTQVQDVTMTAADKFVVLPNATTLGEGANLFVISNRGSTAFGVKNAAGEIILRVAPSQTQSIFSLLDNSTSAGKWASGTISLNVYLNNPNITAIPISTGIFVTVCALSASSVVLSYRTNTAPAGVYVVAGTVSGGVITFGTPVQVSNSSSTAMYATVAYSSTQFVMAYYDANSGQVAVRAGTVSGTTITLGAAPASSLGSTITGVIMISPTVGVWGYNPNSGSQVAFRAFTLSGTTFTFGTTLTVSVGTVSENPYPSSMMQVTSGVMAYDVKVSSGTNAKGFISNSGTTLTLGNTYSRATSSDYFFYSPSSNTIFGNTGVYTLTGSNTISAYTPTANLPTNNMFSYWGFNIPRFSNGVALLPSASSAPASMVYGDNGTMGGWQYLTISGVIGASGTAVLDSTTGIIAASTDNGLLQAYIVKLYWT